MNLSLEINGVRVLHNVHLFWITFRTQIFFVTLYFFFKPPPALNYKMKDGGKIRGEKKKEGINQLVKIIIKNNNK
jgi:hypothetical protein